MKCVTNGILVAALLLATGPARAQQAAPAPVVPATARGPVSLPVEADHRTRLTIGVYVINAAHIGDQALRQAEKQVTRIYQAIGADIEWTYDPANLVQLTIVIASPAMAEHYPRAPGALGLTTSNPWDHARRGYVFADSIEATARDSGLSIPDVLGHAIAHEMGHMLLPHGHSEHGLMRAAWDTNDLRLASRGWLRFTAEQGKLIQAGLEITPSL